MALQDWLDLVDSLPLADTHEHLCEEDTRDTPGGGWQLHDIGMYFAMYPDGDLLSAGMPKGDVDLLTSMGTGPEDKWRLVRPHWDNIKMTGYGQVIRESVRALDGVDDLDDDTWRTVNDNIAKRITPGWYRPILDEQVRIESMQVNSLEHPFYQETLYPDVMLQDLSFLGLSTLPNIGGLQAHFDREAKSLNDLREMVDGIFEEYGPRAVAVKNQGAYVRRLDYEWTEVGDAERSFQAFAKSGFTMAGAERKPLEDWLFHYCVNKAVEYDLPVKLHTGYYTATGYMPLHRVGANPGDCSELCIKHPNARFVFMHTMYPYQDELIAIAKHFPNAFPDMCWSWIINPAATVRFLKEAIKAVPANKIFPFGGDHTQVELIPGHAAIARKGIAQALSELVDEGWLSKRDAEEAAVKLAHGNVRALYDIERCRANNTARERRAPGADGGA